MHCLMTCDLQTSPDCHSRFLSQHEFWSAFQNPLMLFSAEQDLGQCRK